jgi:hypothetical protein
MAVVDMSRRELRFGAEPRYYVDVSLWWVRGTPTRTKHRTITPDLLLSVLTMPRRTFAELKIELEDRLDPQSYDPQQAQKALWSLQNAYPLPPVKIVEPDVWNSAHPVLRFNTHFRADIDDAILNINFSGHAFSPADLYWLKLIHSHWCGWSATTPQVHPSPNSKVLTAQHRNDEWVKFVQNLFCDVHGLVPILDSLAFPEDLVHYPDAHAPPEPSLFFFATPQYYYVFDLQWMGLTRAGETLEEVYTGLKELKYRDFDSGWPAESPVGDCGGINDRNVFPIYELYDRHEFRELEVARAATIMSFHRKDGSVFALHYPLKDFEGLSPHRKLEDL